MHNKITKAPKKDIDYIISLISGVYPVEQNVAETFHENGFSLKLDKGEHLVKQGEECLYIYFILKGALMSYSKSNKKTIITFISIENEFVSSISGFFGKEVSRESIIAAEQVSLIGIHIDVILRLFETSFCLNYIFRDMIIQYYRDAEERAHIVRMGNAKERFLYFQKTKPGYIERLPTEYIAGLLSMKPETFIRIKKQVEEGESKKSDSIKLLRRLEEYIISNETFKDSNITLARLAPALQIPPYKLSRILNEFHRQNFKSYINNYRIEYIKDTLSHSENWHRHTIDALAKTAGFSSRSTFYTVFKQKVGMAPIEYASVFSKKPNNFKNQQ